MDIPAFEYKNITSLSNRDEVMDEIERVIIHLRDVAKTLTTAEIRDKNAMNWFVEHTGWIRALYSRLERLTIDSE